MKTKKGWRGYNFSRAIDGNMIPQRVQNLVIRSYCQSFNLEYLLSATEYSMEGSYMILSSIYSELDSIEGIVFYSVHMLPGDESRRRALYDTVLGKRCGIRFALEELSILKPEDTFLVEEIMMCKNLSSQISTDVDLGKGY